MTMANTLDEIIEQNGVLIGPYRKPRNLALEVPGSIHNDATAQKLGFRGGTVAGSIHMEQFPPILMRAFGERWFETGSLSTYFRFATRHEEPVRTLAHLPPTDAADAQTNVWMERDDGTQILEGTASIGSPPEPSMLRVKVAEQRRPANPRILAGLAMGEVASVPVRLRPEDAEPRLEVITEPLDWYSGSSPWGGPIVNPGLLVHIMSYAQRNMNLPTDAVPLYGAIEIRHLDGPVFVERDYEVTGNILTVGETPQTEYLWFETLLREPGAGPD